MTLFHNKTRIKKEECHDFLPEESPGHVQAGPTMPCVLCSAQAGAVLPAPLCSLQETQNTRTAVAIATPLRPRVKFPRAQKYYL